jgi:hypothetical protein
LKIYKDAAPSVAIVAQKMLAAVTTCAAWFRSAAGTSGWRTLTRALDFLRRMPPADGTGSCSAS